MVDTYQIVLRLVLITILSGIVGYERELHGRAAGLRTTILVGLGSCLIMITSIHIHDIYQGIAYVDPSRIAAQVVSGIGFLGAGTILRFRASVRGLTTAAGIWTIAGVGLAVGCGFYSVALISTIIIFLVLFVLSRLEKKIRKEIYKLLRMEITGGVEQISDILKVFDELQAEIRDIEIVTAPEKDKFSFSIQLKLCEMINNTRITEKLLKVKGVTAIKWD